jgi:hypothetical protein
MAASDAQSRWNGPLLTGLAVRAGIYARYDAGSGPLALAMAANDEETTQLLLDDYRQYLDESGGELPHPALLHEADIVALFDTFPATAAAFMQELKLRPGCHVRTPTFPLLSPQLTSRRRPN